MERCFSVQTKDGKVYKINRKAAELSGMLSEMKEVDDTLAIPLNDIDSKTIEKVIEYLTHFNGNKPQEIQKPLLSTDMKKITDEWSAEFIDKLSIEEIVNLTASAHYFKIDCLLNLCCAKIVSLCKGKSESDIFKIFGVPENYFSSEQKEKIKENYPWVNDIFQ